jgi:hypothetical protein
LKITRTLGLRENWEIFDFELSHEDMNSAATLDRQEQTGPDPETFNDVPEKQSFYDFAWSKIRRGFVISIWSIWPLLTPCFSNAGRTSREMWR